MKTWALWAVLIVVAMLATGCGGGSTRAYDVDVTLDSSLARGGAGAAEVDLVGVSDAQLAQWRDYSLSSYFGGDDPLRSSSLRYPIIFKPGSASKQTLSKSDPIWATWKEAGATNLAVLAQWPGGSAREMVPLDPAAWEERRIGVVVQKTGLQIDGRRPDNSQPDKTKP